MTGGPRSGNRPPDQPQVSASSLPGGSDGGRCPRCGAVIAETDQHTLARCAALAAAAGREQAAVEATGGDCPQCGRPLACFGLDVKPTCCGCRNLPDACPCPRLPEAVP